MYANDLQVRAHGDGGGGYFQPKSQGRQHASTSRTHLGTGASVHSMFVRSARARGWVGPPPAGPPRALPRKKAQGNLKSFISIYFILSAGLKQDFVRITMSRHWIRQLRPGIYENYHESSLDSAAPARNL